MEELARRDWPGLSDLLVTYGVQAYSSGWSKGIFAETLNAVIGLYPWLRGSMAGPWSVLTTWEMLEPPRLHPPLPRKLLLALCAIAAHWEW